MTNPNYVRSTDGNNTDNGSTWTLANATIVGAMTDSVAGDRTVVSQAHAETTAAAVTITLPGTITNPSQLVCANDAAEPPTALATGATVSTSGANSIAIRATGAAYLYGLSFRAGDAANNAVCNLNDTGTGRIVAESCEFILNNSFPGASSQINIGSGASSSGASTKAINCGFKIGHAAQPVVLSGRVHILGGSVLSGSVAPTNGFFTIGAASRDGYVNIDNFDFRNLSSTNSIFTTPGSGAGVGIVRSPLLPASWTGSLVAAAYSIAGQRFEMYDGLSGTTRYHTWITDAFGTQREDLVVVQSGVFAAESTAMSMKMTTSANTKYPALRFESAPMFQYFPGTASEVSGWVPGASKTVTVEYVHDSNVAAGQGAGAGSAFRNDEFALEVRFFGTSGSVVTTMSSSAPADVLATPAANPSSSVTWTTTGLTTPVKGKLSVTIAPQEKGVIEGRVIGMKTGKVLYYTPVMVVS